MNDASIELDGARVGVRGPRDLFEEGLRLSFERSPFCNS